MILLRQKIKWYFLMYMAKGTMQLIIGVKEGGVLNKDRERQGSYLRIFDIEADTYHLFERLVSILLLIVHAVFLLVFWQLGIKQMVHVNWISLAVYAFCIYLSRNGEHLIAGYTLVTIEVMAFSMYAVYII